MSETEPENSPQGSASLQVVSRWHGLEPGHEYAAFTFVTYSEDDTNPYVLGDSQKTVNEWGGIAFMDEIDYLISDQRGWPYEARVCLYEKGSRADAEPATDKNGLPLCAEVYLDPSGYGSGYGGG